MLQNLIWKPLLSRVEVGPGQISGRKTGSVQKACKESGLPDNGWASLRARELPVIDRAEAGSLPARDTRKRSPSFVKHYFLKLLCYHHSVFFHILIPTG